MTLTFYAYLITLIHFQFPNGFSRSTTIATLPATTDSFNSLTDSHRDNKYRGQTARTYFQFPNGFSQYTNTKDIFNS